MLLNFNPTPKRLLVLMWVFWGSCSMLLAQKQINPASYIKPSFLSHSDTEADILIKAIQKRLHADSTYYNPEWVWEHGTQCDESQKEDIFQSNLFSMHDSYAQNEACLEDAVIISPNVSIPFRYLNNEDYFAIWDTQNVNPYPYSIASFSDTVKIALFDLEKETSWSAPLKTTRVTSKFGRRWYRWHHGIDLDLEVGDSVFSAFDGVVRISKYNYRGYGHYVLIRHDNGLETLYGHLNKRLVKVGDQVKAGELIGWGGNTGRSTGSHLHFEVRYKGHAFNPKHMFDFGEKKLLAQEFTINPKVYSGLIANAKAQYHRIRSGDSLWKISRRYRTSIGKLCALNGISRRTTLRVGRRIRVR
ncbi:peptidoglycan DD-metalloendopeptidase family protein [Rapidithrix thailandica]|uniref:Peptidoglycan DD-metalloendopeptidase family protein n=1 Tax=Rapidithrix thailandica TaxID=413964 RepID=A0AAW9RY86_9BACT